MMFFRVLPKLACLLSLTLWSATTVAQSVTSVIDYSPTALLSGENTARRFNLQFSFDRLNFSCSARQSLSESHDRGSGSLSVLEDWHPWQGRFRVSAGVVYLRQHLAYGCDESAPWANIGNAADPQSQRVIDDVMPYMGLGWDGSLLDRERLGVNLDAGLLYGNPDDRLPPGVYRPWRFQPDEGSTLHQLEDLELNPVFSLGVSYTF